MRFLTDVTITSLLNQPLLGTNATGRVVGKTLASAGVVGGSGTADVLPRWSLGGVTLEDSGVSDDANALTVNRRLYTKSPSLNANLATGSSQCEWYAHSVSTDPGRWYKIATFTPVANYGTSGSKLVLEVHCGQYKGVQRTSYYIEMGDRMDTNNPMRYYVRAEGAVRDVGSGIQVYAETGGVGGSLIYQVYLYTLNSYFTGILVTAKNTGYGRVNATFFPNPTAFSTTPPYHIERPPGTLDFDTATAALNWSCFGYANGVAGGGGQPASVFSVTGTITATDNITAPRFLSNVAQGTSPLGITSTTLVANLNADFLDNQHGSYYLGRANHTGTQAWSTITGTPTTLSGYGITDAQPLDGDLTAIAGLTATGYLRRSGTNAWILDATIPWSSISGAPAIGGSSGTVNTHPMWTGTGATLGDSHLKEVNSGGSLYFTGTQVAAYLAMDSVPASANVGFQFLQAGVARFILHTNTSGSDLELACYPTAGGALSTVLDVDRVSRAVDFKVQPTTSYAGPALDLVAARFSNTNNYLPRWVNGAPQLRDSAIYDDGFTVVSSEPLLVRLAAAPNNYLAVEGPNSTVMKFAFRRATVSTNRWTMGPETGDPGEFAFSMWDTAGASASQVLLLGPTCKFNTPVQVISNLLKATALEAENYIKGKYLTLLDGSVFGSDDTDVIAPVKVIRSFGSGGNEVFRVTNQGLVSVYCPSSGQGGIQLGKRTSLLGAENFEIAVEASAGSSGSAPISANTLGFAATPLAGGTVAGWVPTTSARVFGFTSTEDILMSRARTTESMMPANTDRGFFWLNALPSVPTGTPIARGSAAVPLIYNKADDSIYAFNGTWKKQGGTGNLGTVVSVGLALPSIFTVTGSPVTTTGTLTGTLATQAANLVFAGPVSGGAVAPTFRALVAADIPALAYPTGSGTADFTVRWLTTTTMGTGALRDTGTAVGIGKTPTVALDVAGAAAISSTLLVSNQITTNLSFQVTNTDPRLIFYESDGGTDQKRSDFVQQNGNFIGRFYNDALSAAYDWVTVSRGVGTYQANNITLQGTGKLFWGGNQVTMYPSAGGTTNVIPRVTGGGNILGDSGVSDDGANIFTSRVTAIANQHQVRGFTKSKANTANDQLWKIATLIPHASSQGSLLDVDFVGGRFTALLKNNVRLICSNRDAFMAAFQVWGTQRETDSGIKIYQESDGSNSVYAFLAGNQFCSFAVDCRKGDYADTGTILYPNPTDFGPTPTGTLVCDTTADTPIAPIFSVIGTTAKAGANTFLDTSASNQVKTGTINVGNPAGVAGATGTVILNPGTGANAGYVSFWAPLQASGPNYTNTRRGYMGWMTGNNRLSIFADTGWAWEFNLQPYVGTSLITHAAAPTVNTLPRYVSATTGALQDSAISDDGTSLVNCVRPFWITRVAGAASLALNSFTGNSAYMDFIRNDATTSRTRWRFQMDSGSDGTSGTGRAQSNLRLIAYDDAGANPFDILDVNRSSRVVDFKVQPTLNGGPLGGATGSVEVITFLDTNPVGGSWTSLINTTFNPFPDGTNWGYYVTDVLPATYRMSLLHYSGGGVSGSFKVGFQISTSASFPATAATVTVLQTQDIATPGRKTYGLTALTAPTGSAPYYIRFGYSNTGDGTQSFNALMWSLTLRS